MELKQPSTTHPTQRHLAPPDTQQSTGKASKAIAPRKKSPTVGEKKSNAQAVIATGGKQYLVKVGDKILVEKLSDQPGEKVEFADLLSAGVVKAKKLGEVRGKKVAVLKFRPKTRYKRLKSHRFLKTKLEIVGVER